MVLSEEQDHLSCNIYIMEICMAQNKKEKQDAFTLVKQFYKFMSDNKLEIIDYSQNDTHIKLVRKHIPAPTPVFIASQEEAPLPANVHEHKTAHNNKSSGGFALDDKEDTVKATVSGIFYRAPSPASPPYVREGDSVQEGQVICVIEAMKVFNEIKASFDCKIKKVICDNGKPVEPGEDLIIVEEI